MPTIGNSGVTRRLSLRVAGSSINASLGGLSGRTVEVTQSGAGPIALVADQPAGKAGAVTESNLSRKTVLLASAQGVMVGLAVAVAVAVGVIVGVAPEQNAL